MLHYLLFVSALLFFSSAVPSSAATAYPVPVNSPQGKSLCSLLIEPAGYSCTEHTVQTKDGYLLAVQRVGRRRNGNPTHHHRGGPPVFLQHGLFMGGDAWFLGSPQQSLGFILADQGFDVWVGSVRGTFWSHGHVSYSDTSKEFWDWSWQELAEYDLPAMLNHVHTITNSKIYYVGHSQGTLMSFVSLTTQPDVAEMIGGAALLSPISHLGQMTSPLVRKMLELQFDKWFLSMTIPELNFRSDVTARVLDIVCKGPLDCTDMISLLTGKNCCSNESSIDHLLEFEPNPSSMKNLLHFLQMVRTDTAAKYDYGTWKNMWVYGQARPPVYDLSLVPESLPLFVGYGGQDALADVRDVERDLGELRSKPKLLYLENYGHLDFVWSTRGKEDVYDHVIDFFRSLEDSKGSPALAPAPK